MLRKCCLATVSIISNFKRNEKRRRVCGANYTHEDTKIKYYENCSGIKNLVRLLRKNCRIF